MTDQEKLAFRPKRTRIVGQQSKTGCYTCKARHIKCDESKPTCLRCIRSGKVCEGYPERVIILTPNTSSGSSDSEQSDSPPTSPPLTLSLFRPLQDGCLRSSRQDSLAKLGVSILSFDSFGRFGTSGNVLEYLLPQLSHSIPSVNAAAIALGAAYEMQASRQSKSEDKALAASEYRSALKVMQKDIYDQPHGPVPLLMACLLLGITEVFWRQERSALHHMQGAFRILQERRLTKQLGRSECCASDGSGAQYADDDLELLFRGLDLQIVAYALAFKPEVGPASIKPIVIEFGDVTSARTCLVDILHACYSWTSSASEMKYKPHQVGRELLIDQGRHTAHLSLWLERFDRYVLPGLKSSASARALPTLSHALTLRITCLSAMIWVAAVLDPYEMSWDMHGPRFQEIILDAEVIIESRKSEHNPADISGIRFSTGPGIIQPVFLAAEKYRHPLWRRRAILLLLQAGQEGPWIGPREATVAWRSMQYEEAWPERPPPIGDWRSEINESLLEFAGSQTITVSEAARICGCGLYDQNEKDYIRSRFSRCPDIESLILCNQPHGWDVHECEHRDHWEFWEEKLDF